MLKTVERKWSLLNRHFNLNQRFNQPRSLLNRQFNFKPPDIQLLQDICFLCVSADLQLFAADLELFAVRTRHNSYCRASWQPFCHRRIPYQESTTQPRKELMDTYLLDGGLSIIATEERVDSHSVTGGFLTMSQPLKSIWEQLSQISYEIRCGPWCGIGWAYEAMNFWINCEQKEKLCAGQSVIQWLCGDHDYVRKVKKIDFVKWSW